MMMRVVSLAIGYFIGCFQTAYIVGRLVGKIDIREHGSGNAGSTNVLRVMGVKVAALVFIGDIIKAVLAYTLCALLFKGGGAFFSGPNGVIPGLYAGLGIVLGHDFPVFLKFKGGKGVASSLGVILCVDWRVAVIDFIIGLIVIFSTRIVSAASLTMLGLFPVLLIIFKYNAEVVILSFLMGGLSYYMHRGNIERLIKGEERKISIGGKGKTT